MNQESAIQFADAKAFAGLVGVSACVDVGGTKVAVSVADSNGLSGRVTEPTVKEGANDALGQQVARLIAQSCASVGVAVSDIAAVGVSSCGPFVMRDGCVTHASRDVDAPEKAEALRQAE